MIKHLLAGVALLTVASAASATDFTVPLSLDGNTYTAKYGTKGLNGAFSDTFTITPTVPDSILDFNLIQAGIGTAAITFTAISFDGVDFMPFLNAGPGTNFVQVLGKPLSAGSHVIKVSGVSGGNASYSGTVNFEITPVPAPASWAMMATAIAALGFVMRRRMQAASVLPARVSFG